MSKAETAKALRKKGAGRTTGKEQKTDKSKASALSAEKVVDSDSDEAARPAPKSSQGTMKAAAHSKRSSAVAKNPNRHEPQKSCKPHPTAASVNGVKRKQSDSSSHEGEEEDIDDAAGSPAKRRKEVHSSEAAAESSDEDESSGSDEHEAASPTTATKVATGGRADQSASSDSEDEGEDSSNSESAESQPTKHPPSNTVAAKGTSTASDTSLEKHGAAPSPMRSIPAPPFQPPMGYYAVATSSTSTSSPFLDPSGKQVWHIAAPSHVSMQSITEFVMSAVLNGEPVVRHEGIDYTITRDENHQHDAVLFAGTDGYQVSQVHIDTTLHLRQRIALPNLSTKQAEENTGSQAAGDVARAPVSDVRPQPKGLRMRYKPPGFGRGEPAIDGTSSESEDKDSEGDAFQAPKALSIHGTSDKPGSSSTLLEAKVKKDKKKRNKGGDNTLDVKQSFANGTLSMEKQKSEKRDRHRPELRQESAAAGLGRTSESAHRETSDEKARRKEAKRLKKLAKA